MTETLVERIERLVAERGLKASSAAVKAGLSNSYIRDLKRRGNKPNTAALSKLAAALGVDVTYLLHGEYPTPISDAGIPVVGDIQAGNFRDREYLDEDEENERIPVSRDERFAHAKHYALKVRGDSMNELFQDGSYVICVNLLDAGFDLEKAVGKIAHIERRIAGTEFVETTLKEIVHTKNGFVLVPKSTNQKHLPIRVDGDEETEIAVKGIVIGTYRRMEF